MWISFSVSPSSSLSTGIPVQRATTGADIVLVDLLLDHRASSGWSRASSSRSSSGSSP
jgi:hypothetical protein